MNRLEKLLAIFMAPMQRAENVLQDLLNKRGVNTAVGVQLDVLGKIVGQPRNGLIDDDYRRYIRARIATNRSTGKREELINIARLILNDPAAKVFVQQQSIATVFLRIDKVPETAAVEAALINFLRAAVATGVRIEVQTSPVVPGSTFKFAGGVPGPGFDNTAAPGTGGALSDVRD